MVTTELRKLFGLPTAWVGLILGTVAAPILVLVNAPATRRMIAEGRDVADLGYQNLGIGLLGAIILGVVIVSSEYTSTADDAPGARQLTTTLTAMPGRTRLFAAKAAALTTVTAAQGVLTAVLTIILTRLVHGAAHAPWSPARISGAVLYWILLGLMAYAITLATRNGVITLTLLIVNSSVVSVSYLLTRVTSLAAYLPDIVGAHMFLRGDQVERIPPATAGLVMTAWVAAMLFGAALLFHRRDA
jgi:ABC-2 type transport system permease protein